MPNENGYALIRPIRTTVDADRLPAAALSAYLHADSWAEALDTGFQTYLSKPIEPTLLAMTIASRPSLIAATRHEAKPRGRLSSSRSHCSATAPPFRWVNTG
jgi:CheY-like chemotaxis protein